jgi:hypothetical protein
MKKALKILLIVVVVVVCFVAGVFLVVSIRYPDALVVISEMANNYKRAYVYDEDFQRLFDDFESVANMAMKNESELIQRNANSYMIGSDDNGIYLYDLERFERIAIAEDETQSLGRVSRAFQIAGGRFERIAVDDKFVYFEIDNHCFAVVYSRDGSKPTSIAGIDDEVYWFHVREVKNGWYFVTGNFK